MTRIQQIVVGAALAITGVALIASQLFQSNPTPWIFILGVVVGVCGLIAVVDAWRVEGVVEEDDLPKRLAALDDWGFDDIDPDHEPSRLWTRN